MHFTSIKGDFESFEKLLNEIKELPRRRSTVLVGIDGCGGAGKSTFARRMKKLSSDIEIVHMDDFYRPSLEIVVGNPQDKPIGSDFDWKRLASQVLDPLCNDIEAEYQKFNWDTDKVEGKYFVSPGGIVIVEGVYSIRRELRSFYDFKIWIECAREIRLARGLERDGKCARDIWVNNWMVAEDKYLDTHRPFGFAELVVNTSC